MDPNEWTYQSSIAASHFKTKGSRYFDALAHLEDKRVTSPTDCLKRAAQNGVQYILNAGVNPQQDTSIAPPSILQTTGMPTLLRAFGLHPSHANKMDADILLPTLEERISTSPYPCVALGEIGLDRRPNQPALETQLRVFTLQLEFTKAHGLPFIIHSVKSTQMMLEILTKLGPYPRGGMWHSFGGPSEILETLQNLNIRISFGGSITSRKSAKALRTVREAPTEQILIESDTPDHPPKNWPNSLNEPASISEVAETIAQIRNENTQQFSERLFQNAVDFYGAS